MFVYMYVVLWNLIHLCSIFAICRLSNRWLHCLGIMHGISSLYCTRRSGLQLPICSRIRQSRRTWPSIISIRLWTTMASAVSLWCPVAVRDIGIRWEIVNILHNIFKYYSLYYEFILHKDDSIKSIDCAVFVWTPRTGRLWELALPNFVTICLITTRSLNVFKIYATPSVAYLNR